MEDVRHLGKQGVKTGASKSCLLLEIKAAAGLNALYLNPPADILLEQLLGTVY